MCPPASEKPVIGILGGVGAGKSTVAEEFARLGCVRVDGDPIGHALLAEADVQDALRALWGQAVFAPDGAVDRKAVAAIVFQDASALAALNAILHPRIGQALAERIAQARSDPAVKGVVLDAAVLMEAGWDRMCTHLVFVRSDDADRVRRVHDQRGWSLDDWQRREKNQISLDKKAACSDYRVDNSSSVSHLREQVRRIFRQLT